MQIARTRNVILAQRRELYLFYAKVFYSSSSSLLVLLDVSQIRDRDLSNTYSFSSFIIVWEGRKKKETFCCCLCPAELVQQIVMNERTITSPPSSRSPPFLFLKKQITLLVVYIHIYTHIYTRNTTYLIISRTTLLLHKSERDNNNN